MMQSIHEEPAWSLSRVPLFARLSGEERSSLASKVQRRSYRAGEVIFHKDDAGQSFHLIRNGLVKIFLVSNDGQEALLALLKAGEFFGELSLFDGAPRSASATALEPTETLVFHRADFLEFIRQHPEAALSIFGVIAARLRRADGIISDAAFLDLTARIARRLLELAQNFGRVRGGWIEIDIRLRQQDVASMVSATRESVNRTLAQFEEEGIISIDRQRITILRPDLLQQRITV